MRRRAARCRDAGAGVTEVTGRREKCGVRERERRRENLNAGG